MNASTFHSEQDLIQAGTRANGKRLISHATAETLLEQGQANKDFLFTKRSYEQMFQGHLESLAMLLSARSELDHELAIELSEIAGDLAKRLRQVFGLCVKVE